MEIGRNKFESRANAPNFQMGGIWKNELMRGKRVQLLEMGQVAMASSFGNLEREKTIQEIDQSRKSNNLGNLAI